MSIEVAFQLLKIVGERKARSWKGISQNRSERKVKEIPENNLGFNRAIVTVRRLFLVVSILLSQNSVGRATIKNTWKLIMAKTHKANMGMAKER